MEAQPLPEVAWLHTLAVRLIAAKSETPAVHFISDVYAEIVGIPDRRMAFRQLMSTVERLESLVEEIESPGARKTGWRVVNALGELFDPPALAISMTNFRNSNLAKLQLIEAAISSLEDLRYNGSTLEAQTVDFLTAIDELKAKFAASDEISEASKIVLRSQLDLLAKSLNRFSTSGVGPFRESVFCAFGRIVIELKGDSATSKLGYNEVMDGMLRLYGMAEAGGTILRLTGQAMGILPAAE